MGHRIQISRVEVCAAAAGGHGRWPFGTDGLIVFVADVATVSHSSSESTGEARSHHFLQQSRVRDCPIPSAPTISVL
jgi:hypothetical protein